jgi:hypothetical protein
LRLDLRGNPHLGMHLGFCAIIDALKSISSILLK